MFAITLQRIPDRKSCPRKCLVSKKRCALEKFIVPFVDKTAAFFSANMVNKCNGRSNAHSEKYSARRFLKTIRESRSKVTKPVVPVCLIGMYFNVAAVISE